MKNRKVEITSRGDLFVYNDNRLRMVDFICSSGVKNHF